MTEALKKRSKLMFNTWRSDYCCGVVLIGDFQLQQEERWMKEPPKVPKHTFDDGLKLFQEQINQVVKDEYGTDSWNESPEEEPSGFCALQASVANPAAVVANGEFETRSQIVAEEYLKADGWDCTGEFMNVNSGNTVRTYQKIVDAGALIND